ncbi:MAG: hypothetical protein HY363_06435 [Candidatus Aenigmarchaeota archaeon]|nr:hypothetical protein [Candidatus Aenigmarchaeota archaeon]
MAQTVLGNVILFFQQIGIYDVVLPFLLVFAIVFAILEKSMVFGKEPGTNNPRKNLNAIVAFAVAFLVLASAQLVETITTVSSRMVVLMLLVVAFLMLAGMFFKDEEQFKKHLAENWNLFFMIIMFLGVVFVFIASIKTKAGTTWLDELINYVSQFWTSTAVASIMLIIFIIAAVWFIQSPSKSENSATDRAGEEGGHHR